MGLPQRKADNKYTYGDYRKWPEDERWELIDGVDWNMCAATNRRHQEISGWLFYKVYNFLENKMQKCYFGYPCNFVRRRIGDKKEVV